MRTRAILRHHLHANKGGILLFLAINIGAMLLSTLLGLVMTINQSTGTAPQANESSSITLVAYSIYLLVASLIFAQSSTRFLITRSVSRGEIFRSSVLFLLPLCAFMGACMMGQLCLEGIISKIMTGRFSGIAKDLLTQTAPDSGNYLVFFCLSISLLFSVSSLSYLFGTCLARWKMPTLLTTGIIGLSLTALLLVPSGWTSLTKFFRFWFTDAHSGLAIALKHLVMGCAIFALSFPLMRRITVTRAE